MKKLVILGSSGSIGESALRVAAALPDRIQVVGLSVQRRYRRMLDQARCFHVRHVAVADPETAARCAEEAPAGIAVQAGEQGLAALAEAAGADIVLCAVVGIAGLKPVLAAIEHGADVALATKEVLVAAGSIVVEACRRRGVRLLPVDSEHSAIFQCLGRLSGPGGERRRDVRRLVLTASGGPFAGRPDLDLKKVSVAEALNHPRWDMGRKVTVDSATLMNKGLEIMEARWFFDVPIEQIDVVIHPESIVHSMVEFVDGSVIAQMSVPDMRLAIQYALTHPDRCDGGLPRLDMTAVGPLHFLHPDERRFPCLALARQAAGRGGTLPAVLNAANEVGVDRFLHEKIPFGGIWKLVDNVMRKHDVRENPGLDDVLEADAWARATAGDMQC